MRRLSAEHWRVRGSGKEAAQSWLAFALGSEVSHG